MNSELLIVYVKDPEREPVKSRLAAGIGTEAAVHVYTRLLAMVHHCIGELPFDIRISYSTAVSENDIFSKEKWSKVVQKGTDLGERMYNDLQRGIEEGYEKVVLIGSDIPELTPSILLNSFDQLDRRPVVLGPSFDGGYYLIGISHLTPEFNSIFSDIQWSTPGVLKKTLKNAKKANLSVSLLNKLKDIDTETDLNGYEFLLEDFVPVK